MLEVLSACRGLLDTVSFTCAWNVSISEGLAAIGRQHNSELLDVREKLSESARTTGRYGCGTRRLPRSRKCFCRSLATVCTSRGSSRRQYSGHGEWMRRTLVTRTIDMAADAIGDIQSRAGG